MSYELNEYFKYIDDKATCVELYPSKRVAADLLAYHKNNKNQIINLFDSIFPEATQLPMPNIIMSRLDEHIKTQNVRVVVVGIDSYLSLLDEKNVYSFFVALKVRIEEQKLNAVYLLSASHDFMNCFKNPKYEDSMQVVKLSGQYDVVLPFQLDIIPSRWYDDVNLPHNYKELFEREDDFSLEGYYIMVVQDSFGVQAGLSNNVKFAFDVKTVAKSLYGTDLIMDLDEITLEHLMIQCKKNGLLPRLLLEERFGKSNISVTLAIKRLQELDSDALWSAYIILLLKKINRNTYIHKVLSSGVSYDTLLQKYIVDIPVEILNDGKQEIYASERAAVIKTLGVVADPWITEFICKTQTFESAITFLNCGTFAEHMELIRRASKCDLRYGLSDVFKGIFPLLAEYLSTEYDYGDKSLNSYFDEYRKQKIRNMVSEEFVKKAFVQSISSTIEARDVALSNYSADKQTALLVVDGMGAEYSPLLVEIAKRSNLNIEYSKIVSAKMPTSTEYNSITWDSSRLLNEIKSVDTIAHYGAVKNEFCSPERNIATIFRLIESEVINRIKDGLMKYSRVIVTSDHGASRLAVVAHNNKLSETLPWNGDPLDWRYSVALQGVERPKEFEAQYNAEKEITYWIVKGYNRLPKKGPKLNELHGGASLEERLVPFVVFSREKREVVALQNSNLVLDQIIEKSDFNDI